MIICVFTSIFMQCLPAMAVSFNCDLASTHVEHMICSDPVLSKLDDELASTYSMATKDAPRVPQIRSEQRAWIAERNRCVTADCVAEAFHKRIAELRAYANSSQTAGAQPKAPIPAEGRARVAVGDNIAYGSRAGMDLTVVAVSGIGSDKASIDVAQTLKNASAYCVEYMNEAVPTKGCIDKRMKDAGNHFDALKANCVTGMFISYGSHRRFIGRNRDFSPEQFDVGPKFLIANIDSKEILSDTSASGYARDLDVYKALCPGQFLASPTIEIQTALQNSSLFSDDASSETFEFPALAFQYSNSTDIQKKQIRKKVVGSLIQGEGALDNAKECGILSPTVNKPCYEITLSAGDSINIIIYARKSAQNQNIESFNLGGVITFKGCKISSIESLLGFTRIDCDSP
jgi:uncharacterized protein